ncbi:MAG: hypothetical protein FD174_1621 [Geobacteraceae bacterium]|nr:MAG: hypothetical protein FD174_1621 [Geobacteraceae bacterium]
MKNLVLCLCAFFLVAAGSEAAHADFSYSAVYEYGNGAGMHQPLSGGGSFGADYVTISKSGSLAFYDQFDLGGIGNLTAATLSITHNGNFDIVLPTGFGEQWKAVGNNGVMLGTLSNSFYDWNTGTLITSWVTDTFQLGPDALAVINNANPKYLGISFVDGTLGLNTFKVNSVALEATASPVPLPPAILLFGSGIVGLAGLRRMML